MSAPFHVLKHEHRVIEKVLRALEGVCFRLKAQEDVPVIDILQLLDFISGFENVTGSDFNDILTGDSGTNLIFGGAGNDTINGGDGDDILNGGNGDDKLDGGNGTDTATYNDAAGGVTVSLAST